MSTLNITGNSFELLDSVKDHNIKNRANKPTKPNTTELFGRMGKGILQFFDKLPDNAFFLAIFLFLCLLTLQGFELSDEGFLINYYNGIFEDPLSLSYNFMFWLTGVIGGIWMKVFGFMGLWGARLAGVFVNMFTLIATYRLLRKYIQPAHLKIGLLCVILCLNNDIKILNYNTLSALTFVLLAGFMIRGLLENRNMFFLVAGALVCMNSFIRIPNVLQLGLVLVFAYHNWIKKIPFTRTIRQSLVFFAGFLGCLVLMLLTIRLLGHWEAFNTAMDFLFRMGDSQSTEKIRNDDYGMKNLIFQSLYYNARSLFYALATVLLILTIKFADTHIMSRNKYLRGIFLAGYYATVLLIFFWIAKQKIDKLDVVMMIYGIPLLTLIPFLISSDKKDFQLIYITGIFFLLSFPAGSSHSVLSAGRFCLWLALPIALDFLLNLSSIKFGLDFSQPSGGKGRIRFHVSEQETSNAIALLIILILGAGLIHQYYYPFFDWRDRTKMTHTVDSDKFKFIHTTEDRATEINKLLKACSTYCDKGDYVMMYDRIPMIFYATDTRSFLSNPFPGVYRPDLFKADLESSLKRHGFLPVVVEQLIHTTGQGSKWPTEIIVDPTLKFEDEGRDQILSAFLQKYEYKETWKSNTFRILVPGVSKP